MNEHSLNLRSVGKLLRGALHYPDASNVDQAADYIEDLTQTVAELRAERERLITCLTPRQWTQAHYHAWHREIPDAIGAFAALLALASPPAASDGEKP